MIFYGDPSTQESFRSLVADLKESLSAVGPTLPDDRRCRLIQAGMLEQALEDACVVEAAFARKVTDALARAFVDQGDERPDLGSLLAAPDQSLTIKVPEGFAFYGLYPEAYVAAARAWAKERPRGRVAVLGLRSIGTTLSAVVAATLEIMGFRVSRKTVRPTGHPFTRETTVPRTECDWSIVVDEGPGLSGSSMASVGEALVRGGFPRERIAFFPGHGGEPGTHASETTRAWWRDTPRYTMPTEMLRWDGLSLEETLMARTDDAVRIEELSGGRWRDVAYDDPAQWPAVTLASERRKLRVFRQDGSSVLWKFVGLTVPETALGFAPAPWIEGEPLQRSDATAQLVEGIGRHIIAVAGPPLAPAEARAARARLEEMMRVNAAEAGVPLTPALLPQKGEGMLSAGGYRLAPWEWRRLSNGEIVQAGRTAPTLDHTIVGRQPLAWDVAGAMVEWGLDDPSGLPCVADLTFYRAAYAAFRMGQCAMFAGPDEEGVRLRGEAAFYRESLSRCLHPTPTTILSRSEDYVGSDGSSPV